MAPLPAAAPLPARALLTGPPRPGRVVGVHPSCVYVVVDRAAGSGEASVVAVESADGVGLPCALRVGADSPAGPFRGIRAGDRAEVGGARLVAGPLRLRIVRWWAPASVREPRGTDAAVGALAGLLRDIAPPVDPTAAPRELLGRGPGLTPAGDDLLAGWLLAVRHDPGRRAGLLRAIGAPAARTTTLSAALLAEAAEGRGVPPAVALAEALGGHGEVAPALARLLRVGHTSGAALAHGLLRGAGRAAGVAA